MCTVHHWQLNAKVNQNLVKSKSLTWGESEIGVERAWRARDNPSLLWSNLSQEPTTLCRTMDGYASS